MHGTAASGTGPLASLRRLAGSRPAAALQLYALAEPARNAAIWQRLQRQGRRTLSLLGLQGRPADAFGPQLVALGAAAAPSEALEQACALPHPPDAFTLLCTALPPEALQAHLRRFADVRLAGGMEMVLALWDPAILGTLVGQADDTTLHVPGPVLDPRQLHGLLAPLAAWWYCDRAAGWHCIAGPDAPATGAAPPALGLGLTQAQEDLLVEASVPDQVLYQLELNQPLLFDAAKTHAARHGFVRAVLGPARQLGLAGLRDLVNFTALCLVYRRRLQTDPAILHLLDQVRTKTLTLDQAMPQMPP